MGNQSFVELPDGYTTVRRSWGKEDAPDVFILLHGLVTHSGVFESLGRAAELSERPYRLVAEDRRGAGLASVGRGDLPGGLSQIVDDVCLSVRREARGAARVHLVSWCAAIGIAARVMDRLGTDVRSACHLAPTLRGAESEHLIHSGIRFAARAQNVPFDEVIDGFDYWLDGGFGVDYSHDDLMLRRLTPRLAFAYVEANHGVAELLSRFQGPQAVLIALADKLSVPERTKALLSDGGFSGTIEEVEGAQHAIWEHGAPKVLESLNRLAG